MRLTEAQIADFHENGYIHIVDGVLGDDDLGPVIAEYEALVGRRARQLVADGKLTTLYEGEPFQRRMTLIAAEAPEIGDRLDIRFVRGRAMFDFLHCPRLLDLAESLIGPELQCSPIQHIRSVPPEASAMHNSRSHHWHQDAGTVLPEADNQIIATMWIPLFDVPEDGGCLELLPGSHKHGLRRHLVNGEIRVDPQEVPALTPKLLPTRAGGLILFHPLMMHRSQPNVSDRVRWSMDLRYQDSAKPTGRPFLPGFVVRSAARPETVLTDYERWNVLWDAAMAPLADIPYDEYLKMVYRWPAGEHVG